MVRQLIVIMIVQAISIYAARSQQIATSSMCEGKEINSFVPDPENCSKFFQCNGDTFIHGSCPSGMFYHPQDVCSFDDSDCSSSTEQPTTSSSSSTTDESNVTSSTGIPEYSSTTAASTDPEQWCADVDPNRPHFVKSPTQCSEYYICVEGKAIRRKCPEGKYWSAEHFYCDDSKNVPCVFDRIPNPEQYCNASTEEEISFTASPTDCGEYYICVKRLPFLMRCAPGSQWNDNIKQCDDPRDAGCKVINTSLDDLYVLCPTSGESFTGHPKYCNLFIFCRNGKASTQLCPFLTDWDTVAERCLPRHQTKCSKPRIH